MRFFAMILCTALLVGTSNNSYSQTVPTLEELLPGGSNYRYAENIHALQWWGDTCIKPDIDTLFTINPQTGKEELLLTREQVNHVLSDASLGKIPHFYNIRFPWPHESKMLIYLPGKYIVYDLSAHRIVNVRTMQEEFANADYAPLTGNVAYTLANNLYVNDAAVTNEPEGVVCGRSVHRNEFGIEKGTFWSPSGNLLAFYRMDESMVTQYPLVNTDARTAELTNIRYPMAGMTTHQVSVGIYYPSTERTVFLNTGDPTDRYFTNISWAPDEKSLYLIELNRDQNHAKLCRYDVTSGELLATLLEETHPKYVEPTHPILFLPWDNGKFIYQSQQDGFNHLYLYDAEGKLIRQITSGSWLVQGILGFDEKNKEVFITSTEYSPLQSTIFRVHISSGKRTPVGKAIGIHSGDLSKSGKYIIDSFSAPDIPRNIDIVDTRKGKTINLLTAADPFDGYKMPAIETGTIKAADGVTDLYYRLVKPVDFDANKKYPAIIYVYGGPHAQNITNGFRNAVRGWDIYMAGKGYVMLTLDNRGSSNRGLEFENCTFRKLGIEEGKDQVKGAEYLISLPFVDSNRIGIHGWSYGGHMTTALMLRYPEIFKVGVAGGPVIDWKYYEIMYGERYMDTPQTNPEGYEETDLKNLAENLKGRLLIIHGDQDDTCVPQHTFSFMKACIDARTYPDLFIYPGHKHNMMGRDRVHLHEKITSYFEEHL